MDPIRDRLDQVKRRAKLAEAAAVGLTLATFAAVFLSTEIVLDRLFLLDRSFRATALLAFAILGGGAIVAGLILAGRRISDVYAARLLERHQPDLKQSLITWVQLQTGDALGSDLALEHIERTLGNRLERNDAWRLMKRRLLALAAASGVLVAIFVGTSAAIAGRGFPVCLDRVLRPGASIAPPTMTRIVEVLPGDLRVLLAADVAVAARIEGAVPREALVYLSYEEGSWFTVPMREEAGRWNATLPGAQNSFRYFIAAADTRSDLYTVTVLPPPVLTGFHAWVDLPGYTHVSQKTVNGGDFECLPGSFVTMRGYPNRALKSAAMVFDNGDRVPFRVRGAERVIAEFSPTTGGPYRLELVDEFGLTSPSPQRFRIEVREDRAPEITIVQPGPSAEQLPDQPIELTVDAVDDYGILVMELVFRRRGAAEQRVMLPFNPAAGSRQSFTFKPAEFALQAPGSMMCFVEARDRSPSKQVGRSAIHVLHLRRRPLDDLAPYEPLKKSLRELASSDGMRRKLGLEEQVEKSDEQKRREAEAMASLRDLLSKQRDLVKQIRDLGPDRNDDLKRLRDELRDLQKEARDRDAQTRELPSRGVSRQESLADALAQQLQQLQRRAEALRRQLAELAQEKEIPRRRAEALKKAAQRLADATRSLEAAARSLQNRDAAGSLESQQSAQRDMDAARQAIDDLLSSDLAEEDRRKAEELAKIEKLLRERTEELREKVDPDDADRLRAAQKAMRDAQRSLEQGDPGAAGEQANEAAEQLEQAAQPETPKEPGAEIPEELALSLSAALKKMLSEQESVHAETREIDGRRTGGVTKKEDVAALRVLAKREEALAAKAREVSRDLERENAEVYRWTLEAVAGSLVEARDLIDVEQRTDGYLQHLQLEVIERLKQLIEALKPQPRPPGAGGGGGGGKPVKVGFEAQLKLIRSVQAEILWKTQAVRARAEGGLNQSDQMILNRLFQQQEDLRRLVGELAASMEKDE